MNVVFEHIDNIKRNYQGILLDNKEFEELAQDKVRNLLIDKPQRDSLLEQLKSLEQDTGFKASKTLLIDIQALTDTKVNVRDFRIGEALAEVILTENFRCRFYWNELRDTRNPEGNKAGADLVGFIEIENEVLFLFGEVKTSSEQKHPPQVMTNPKGMENQIKELYNNQSKRRILISYLCSKLNSVEGNLKQDFENAKKNYYKENGEYLLYGVLVRDVEPNEDDLKSSYNELKQHMLDYIGLKLLAIYVPIKKENWLKIING